MPEVYKLREVLVHDESTFAEDANDLTAAGVASDSYTNVRFLDATMTLVNQRDADGSSQSRLAERAWSHKGAREATLTFSQYIVGHGADPTGALTKTQQMGLLGDGLGGYSGGTSGVASGVPTTTSVPYSSGTFAAEQVLRFGSVGDGRAEGTPSITTASSTPAALRFALPAAPNAADVVRAAMMAYHVEGATLQSKRFWVRHRDTAANWVLAGGQLSGLRYTLPINGKGTIEYTYRLAYHDRNTSTFPATAAASYDCAPIAGGGCLLQDVGTTTRNTINPAQVSLNVNLDLSPIVGQPGSGGGAYQYITGWTRTGFGATCELTIPWTTSYASFWSTENASNTAKNLLWWANTANGRSYGFALRYARPIGDDFARPMNVNGQLYTKLMLDAGEHTVTTNDLTRASFVHWAC